VSELPSQVEQSIRARRLFARGQRILVAVSGGVDSMVLLHVLHGLAPVHRWRLSVAHLNHRLRGVSSDADERLVRRAGKRLRLPVRVARVDVRRYSQASRISLEMAARKVRHEFLARTAKETGTPCVALAHHADDQLELFFLRLLRGSGGEGLAGMKWRNSSPADRRVELVRPLLDQPKSALRDYALEAGIRFHEDASNACLDMQRNRIRHELLPLLRTKYQPALSKTILRTAEIVGAEAEFAAQSAQEWLKRLAADKRHRHPATSFEKLPVAVQRQAVRIQLLGHGIAADYSLVELLLSAPDKPVTVGPCQPGSGNAGSLKGLATRRARPADTARLGDIPGTTGLPLSLVAVRDRAGQVHLNMPTAKGFIPGSVELVLSGGRGQVAFAGAVIRWQVQRGRGDKRPPARAGREFFDADKVGSPILLRHWKPGDRFQPIGMAQPVKLQDLFTNRKVPRDRRRQLIVAANAAGEVFWVEDIRISERFKLSKESTRRLHWRWKRP
jgi:tRNA(Ile)-lysidine synthase